MNVAQKDTTANGLRDGHNSTQPESLPDREEQQQPPVNDPDDNHVSPASEVAPQFRQENMSVSNVDEKTVNRLVEETIKMITEGFKIIHKSPVTFTSEVGAEPHMSSKQDLVLHRIQQLLGQAKAAVTVGYTKSWYCNFLAGAIWEYFSPRTNGAIPKWNEKVMRHLNVWATNVQVVNGIVRGLHSTWKKEAYSVFDALAG